MAADAPADEGARKNSMSSASAAYASEEALRPRRMSDPSRRGNEIQRVKCDKDSLLLQAQNLAQLEVEHQHSDELVDKALTSPARLSSQQPNGQSNGHGQPIYGSGGDLSPASKLLRTRAGQKKKAAESAPASSSSRPATGVFAYSAETMKARLKEKLTKKEYNVFDYYHETGCWQRIARSTYFDSMTLIVIFLNALWIWIDTDYNHSDSLLEANAVFILGENMFCTYFFGEWLIRFMSFRRKRDCLRDMWMVFDSALVICIVFETWIMTLVLVLISGASASGMGNASLLRMARLLRLMRMARMARLLRAMPELMTMVRGVIASTRSVFLAGVLLLIIQYVFGIALVQLSSDTVMGEECFPTVPKAMFFLLVEGVFLDEFGDAIRRIGAGSTFCAILFFVFVLLAGLTVMNMLIGVVCELVSAVASQEKEERTIVTVKEKVTRVLCRIDEDGDGKISKDEFLQMLDDEECIEALAQVGVDVLGLADLMEIIFRKDGEIRDMLTFEEFIETIYGLRGSNTASVKDIVDLRKFVYQTVTHMNTTNNANAAKSGNGSDNNHEALSGRLDGLESRMGKLETSTNRMLQILECQCEWPAGITRTKL